METVTTENYLTVVSKRLDQITKDTWLKPAWWVGGVELMGLANSLDTSGLTDEFIREQIAMLRAWFNVDSHNWSDFAKAGVTNRIHFWQYVLGQRNLTNS
jgi:hypothetical protein